MFKKFILIFSFLITFVLGVGSGIYVFPYWLTPDSVSVSEIDAQSLEYQFQGEFKRDLKDSDRFHWGEGELFVGEDVIVFKGELAPGPDYKLYLSPNFLETEAEFESQVSQMLPVTDIKVFKDFVAVLPDSVDINKYNTVIIWCETFREFISAAKYR